MELLGMISVGFDLTNQTLARYLHLSDTGEKMGVE
jgi:hypothetical protein